MGAEIYNIIQSMSQLFQEVEQIKNRMAHKTDLDHLKEQVAYKEDQNLLKETVVYKTELAILLKDLEDRFEEMFQNAIQRLGTIARDEISNIFVPFHDSLKAEFKQCLDSALHRLQNTTP